MTSLDYAPTLSELRGAKQDREINRHRVLGSIKYKVGDIVEFMWCGLKKAGRITSAFHIREGFVFNISTASGQWYRHVAQNLITEKLVPEQPTFEHAPRFNRRNLKFV